MSVNQREILDAFGSQIVAEIKSKIPNATGGTAAGIWHKATETTLTVYGPSYIMALEYGRGPTKTRTASSPTLRERIREWIEAKDIVARPDKKGRIPSTDSLAYMISKSIHKKGTKLYQSGRQSGVITSVITEERIQEFLKRYAASFLNTFEADIKRKIAA